MGGVKDPDKHGESSKQKGLGRPTGSNQDLPLHQNTTQSQLHILSSS